MATSTGSAFSSSLPTLSAAAAAAAAAAAVASSPFSASTPSLVGPAQEAELDHDYTMMSGSVDDEFDFDHRNHHRRPPPRKTEMVAMQEPTPTHLMPPVQSSPPSSSASTSDEDSQPLTASNQKHQHPQHGSSNSSIVTNQSGNKRNSAIAEESEEEIEEGEEEEEEEDELNDGRTLQLFFFFRSLRQFVVPFLSVLYWLGLWNLLDLWVFYSEDTTVRDACYTVVGSILVFIGDLRLSKVMTTLRRPGSSLSALVKADSRLDFAANSFNSRLKLRAIVDTVYMEVAAIMMWTGLWNLLNQRLVRISVWRDLTYFLVGLVCLIVVLLFLHDHSIRHFLGLRRRRKMEQTATAGAGPGVGDNTGLSMAASAAKKKKKKAMKSTGGGKKKGYVPLSQADIAFVLGTNSSNVNSAGGSSHSNINNNITTVQLVPAFS